MQKVAIVGAGKAGSALLPILYEYSDIKVVGVADIKEDAPGIIIAKQRKIPIFSDYREVFKIKSLNVILNLTGDLSVSERLTELTKNKKIEIISGLGVKLLWDIVYEKKKKEEEEIRLIEKLAKTNQELNETKKYLENILENSADMIITTDINGKIVKFNKGAESILGFKREEVIGKSIEDFYINREDRRQILKCIERQGSISNCEIRLKNKTGDIVYISLTLTQLRNEEGEIIGAVGISKDITEKKKLEKEFLQSNKELENFVYTISHDLQAPLRAIDGFASLLLEEYYSRLDEEGLRYLERIKKAAYRMKLLIEDLLELSKIGRIETPYQYVSFQEIMREVKENLYFDLEKTEAELRLSNNALNTIRDIYCIKPRVVEIFINLITNSIKYIKDNVKPIIEVDCVEEEDYIKFSVKDNGIGIDKQYHTKIFELFQRLHTMEEYEGTGVGLAIVKRIVDLHEGHIWLDSEPGKGTIFYFSIPKQAKEKKAKNG